MPGDWDSIHLTTRNGQNEKLTWALWSQDDFETGGVSKTKWSKNGKKKTCLLNCPAITVLRLVTIFDVWCRKKTTVVPGALVSKHSLVLYCKMPHFIPANLPDPSTRFPVLFRTTYCCLLLLLLLLLLRLLLSLLRRSLLLPCGAYCFHRRSERNTKAKANSAFNP